MDRSAELHRLLAEYRAMEKEMARLEETKKTLRAAIQRVLEEEGKSAFAAIVNGEQVLLELKSHMEIRYDENLRERDWARNTSGFCSRISPKSAAIWLSWARFWPLTWKKSVPPPDKK